MVVDSEALFFNGLIALFINVPFLLSAYLVGRIQSRYPFFRETIINLHVKIINSTDLTQIKKHIEGILRGTTKYSLSFWVKRYLKRKLEDINSGQIQKEEFLEFRRRVTEYLERKMK